MAAYYRTIEAILPIVTLVVDQQDIVCINTDTHELVADAKIMFVGKYIKAYQDMSVVYEDTKRIDDRLTPDMDEIGEQISFADCADQAEAINRLESLEIGRASGRERVSA